MQLSTRIAIATPFVCVLLVAGYVYGCSHKAAGSGTPAIQNVADYKELNEEAAFLSKGPLTKILNHVELDDQDKVALNKAYDDYRGLLKFQPDDAAPYAICGTIEQALGNDEKALDSFHQFDKLWKPGKDANRITLAADVHNESSQSLMHLSRYQEAAQEATLALALVPNSTEYLFSRASAMAQMGKYDDARKDLKAALALNPDDDKSKGLSKLIAGKRG